MHVPIDLRRLGELGVGVLKDICGDLWGDEGIDEGIDRKGWKDLMSVEW